MATDEPRYRLVVLGAGRVGKSSVVSRLLSGRFSDSYRPTVEDLHCREFSVSGSTIKLDILDTAGNLEFPAMRRLSISTANAFLLVFAVDSRDSFETVKELWEQIRDLRGSNYRDLPCVVVANKCDIVASRLMAMDVTADWSRDQGLETAVVEVSHGVRVFRVEPAVAEVSDGVRVFIVETAVVEVSHGVKVFGQPVSRTLS